MAENMKLSPPWITYIRKLEKLFERDDEVNVLYDDNSDAPKVKLFCATEAKYDAWMRLLPMTVDFGNVTLSVIVIPPNGNVDYGDILSKAFDGNPILKDIKRIDNVPLMREWYVLFEPVVVQYMNDDITSPYGITSTLYADIANDVINVDNSVAFTTARIPTPSKDA